jgi:hypothetical protein
MWKRRNQNFLKALELVRPRPGTKILIDYREDIHLEK